eukprot:CAMPEP_0169407756 /NCGR_PEP_ID=MMETSP1017-20121227/58284_1 /TAXON_ID=342587 /ORGANISM="Karlodinium micrum, Strain CCMP2283" /LENGTH=184 /DNA_ID=CAMNT_0009514709 /DNA_START=158 /DNA_END=709 /DNA_ORIENTATION=-
MAEAHVLGEISENSEVWKFNALQSSISTGLWTCWSCRLHASSSIIPDDKRTLSMLSLSHGVFSISYAPSLSAESNIGWSVGRSTPCSWRFSRTASMYFVRNASDADGRCEGHLSNKHFTNETASAERNSRADTVLLWRSTVPSNTGANVGGVPSIIAFFIPSAEPFVSASYGNAPNIKVYTSTP